MSQKYTGDKMNSSQSIKKWISCSLVLFLLTGSLKAVTREELIKRVDKQQEEIDQLKEELSLMDSSESDDILKSIDIHGFISQGYLKSWNNNFIADSVDGSFEYNEIGINFSTNLDDNLRAGLQLFSRDYGDIGNNDIEIDWAYIDYRMEDWLGFRAGKIKQPKGLYNETRDIDLLRTSVFLPSSLYDESLRDLFISIQGVGAYGNIPLDEWGDISYQYQYGSNDFEEDGGSARNFEDSGAYDVEDLDADYIYVQHIVWNTPIEGLRFVGTITKIQDFRGTGSTLPGGMIQGVPLSGTPPLGFGLPDGSPFFIELTNVTNYVGAVEWSHGNLVLMAEYTEARARLNVNDIVIPGVIDLSNSLFHVAGWYAGGSYRFNEFFEMGAYYSNAFNPDDKDNLDTETVSLAARFDITENWIFKVEGQWRQGKHGMFALDNPDGFKEDTFLLVFKTTVSF